MRLQHFVPTEIVPLQSVHSVLFSGVAEDFPGFFGSAPHDQPHGTLGDDEVVPDEEQRGRGHGQPGVSPIGQTVNHESRGYEPERPSDETGAQPHHGSPFPAQNLHDPDPHDGPGGVAGEGEGELQHQEEAEIGDEEMGQRRGRPEHHEKEHGVLPAVLVGQRPRGQTADQHPEEEDDLADGQQMRSFSS